MDTTSYLLGKKAGGGGGGTSDYSALTNKPSINGVTLAGDKTSEDLGIESAVATEITIDLQKVNDSTLLEEVGELISNNVDKVVKVNVIDGSVFMSEGYIQVSNYFTTFTPVGTYTGNFGTAYTTVQISGSWNTGRTEYTVSSLQSVSMNINKSLAVDNTSIFTPTGDYQPATKKYVDDNAGGGIQKLVGTESNPIIIDDLDNGIYLISGATKEIASQQYTTNYTSRGALVFKTDYYNNNWNRRIFRVQHNGSYFSLTYRSQGVTSWTEINIDFLNNRASTVGVASQMTTTAKDTLVAAINELDARLKVLEGN